MTNESPRDSASCLSFAHLGNVAWNAVKTNAAIAVFFLIAALSASAQTTFAPLQIGSTTSQAISVTSPGGGLVTGVEVLTYGATGGDFAQVAAGSICPTAVLSVGGQCTEMVSFTPAYPGTRLGAVVLLSGNSVIGTAFLSGTGTGGLGLLFPGTMETFAGDGDWKEVGDGGLAINGELFLPASVALDGAGNVYIADSDHNRIRMVCAATTATIAGTSCTGTGIISTVAGAEGIVGYAGDGQQAGSVLVELNTPSGVAVDGAGNLYIADTGNSAIREINVATGLISTIAGSGNGSPGFSGDNSPAIGAALNQPTGVAVDSNGNVFVADTENNRIRVICASSGSIYGVSCPAAGDIVTVAGGGTGTDGAQATAASLADPYTISFDPSSNLYIADSGDNRIRAVCLTSTSTIFGAACPAAGVISTVAGNGNKGYSGDAGPATSAELNSPSGLAFDPAGNLYVSDTQNFRIRKVNLGGTIDTIAGAGQADFKGDGGPAPAADLYGPYGIALDPNGNLYIAEYLDNRVREVQGNLSIVDVPTPVRQGSTSPTTAVTVENVGNSPLALTTITASGNSQINTTVANPCAAGNFLAADQECTVGAQFAPAATPTLTGNVAETGNIDVSDNTVTGVTGSNSPLDIEVDGTATPVNATTVALVSSQNPSAFGQNVTFTATVTTGAGTGKLTGTVSFLDGTTTLIASAALNSSGVATYSTSALTVGTHNITASYNGDPGHFKSTSAVLTQVVNEATSTTIKSSVNPSALNASVTFTATVASSGGGGPTPDGTVAFKDGANTLATITLSGTGTATFSTSTLAQGSHAITAVYSGDSVNFIGGSTSAVLSQDVLAGSTVTVASSLNPSTYGTSVTFTAAVTSAGTIAPTGSVSFLDGGKQIGTGPLTGTAATGTATFATVNLAAGAHTITASYAGDSNVGPGTSTAITQTVNPVQTTTTLTAAPATGLAGLPVTLTATVTGGLATETGSVAFTDGATTLGTVSLTAAGTATLSPKLAAGTHSLVATYSGDTSDKGSASATLPYTVILATTQVALTSSGSPAVVLSPVTFTAAVTGNGVAPTGSVSFTVDGTAAGMGTVNGSGVATFSDSALTVGTHAIVATYSGDANDNPSTSATLSQVIGTISTTTDLGASATSGSQPQAILVATTLSASGPAPTGTITFTNSGTTIGSAPLDSNGVATLVPNLAPGSYSIVASYGGDALHTASTSASVTISGAPAGFSIAVTPGSLNLVSSQNGTVSVSLSSNAGFSDTIGMGCLSMPAAVNCHFSSNSVKLASGQTQTVQLTIDTDSPLSGGQSASNAKHSGGSVSMATLFLPASLLFGLVFWRFRRRHAALLLASLALFLVGAFAMTGCSSSFSQVSAAPGTYTIQIGGVGTNSNISHYETFTLTVTK